MNLLVSLFGFRAFTVWSDEEYNFTVIFFNYDFNGKINYL